MENVPPLALPAEAEPFLKETGKYCLGFSPTTST
jgi:hypothetical protein